MEMSSPRLSFSSDLPPSPPISRLDDSLPLEPPSDEFDFSTSSHYSTPADLLFSQGRLLPLHNSALPPPILPKNRQTLKQILAKDHHDHDNDDDVASCSSRKSSASVTSSTHATHPFWHAFTRSSSLSVVVGSGNKTGTGPFPRSKSTGCNPDRSLRPTKTRKQDARLGSKFWKSSTSPRESTSSSTSSSNAKAYYYSRDRRGVSNGSGVRINPVINLPAPFFTRGGSSNSNSSSSVGVGGSASSFFAYLLCNCRDKTMGARKEGS